MNLEHKILHYLSNHHHGNFVDITFIDDDYDTMSSTLRELQGKNLVIVDSRKRRDFGSLGISYERKKILRAKINSNGRFYLHQLENKILKNRKRKKWRFASLFNF